MKLDGSRVLLTGATGGLGQAIARALAERGALLILTGPLTALPLLLFAAGARRIPLTTLGLLQYISPTIQLVLGILVFDEPFTGSALAGYAAIWTALALYVVEGLVRARRT